MRKPKAEELQAIASLYHLEQKDREMEQASKQTAHAIHFGQKLPLIHQVMWC
jgi:hypothetical protein